MCNEKAEDKPPGTYHERGKRWNSYEYKGVVGIQPISREYGVPVPHLIARMRKGMSLEEAVTYIKPIGTDTRNRANPKLIYEPINFSEVVAKMSPSKYKAIAVELEKKSAQEWSECKERNKAEPIPIYTMKDYQKSDVFSFPDSIPLLWQLALGLSLPLNR